MSDRDEDNRLLNRYIFGDKSEPMPELRDICGVRCAVYPNGLIYRANDGCLMEVIDGELVEVRGPLTFDRLPDNLSSGDVVRPQDLGRFIGREELARTQVARMEWPSSLDAVEAMDWPDSVPGPVEHRTDAPDHVEGGSGGAGDA